MLFGFHVKHFFVYPCPGWLSMAVCAGCVATITCYSTGVCVLADHNVKLMIRQRCCKVIVIIKICLSYVLLLYNFITFTAAHHKRQSRLFGHTSALSSFSQVYKTHLLRKLWSKKHNYRYTVVLCQQRAELFVFSCELDLSIPNTQMSNTNTHFVPHYLCCT